jgi:type IV pilus assembly protein PilB
MMVNGKLREMMFRAKSSIELRDEAIRQGMTTLYCDGIRKVMRGITTLEEVYRVSKKTEIEDIALSRVYTEFVGTKTS